MEKGIKKHYETLVCGATFSGIGAALADPENTLVLERLGAVGQEFIESFNPGNFGARLSLTDFGQAFVGELRERNLIAQTGGPIHLPGLHPILCRKVLEASSNVIFLTEIVNVAPLAQGFEVAFFNTSGIQSITVNRIVDTTTSKLSRLDDRFVPTARRLNAYIVADIPDLALPKINHPKVELVQGRFASEHILKWSLEAGENWSAARSGLLQFWRSRHASLLPWTIAATASVLECEAPRGVQRLADNWLWQPSEGYAHPVEALDQGYVHQLQRKERSDGYFKKI